MDSLGLSRGWCCYKSMIQANPKFGLSSDENAILSCEVRQSGIPKISPVVSICMPHLNSWPFTQERIETILAQTYHNWELIIVDSNSDDGSLELLESYTAQEPRIRLSQAPRDGIYSNLNRTLDKCQGDFIYIAMSDDTMKPECLDRMVNALQQNPDCGICHCRLEIIDENGSPKRDDNEWESLLTQQLFGDWVRTPHVRRAPHDGLLHFCSGTIYTSLTQLLVRKTVFKDIGIFRTDSGSHADFEWGMRVGLSEDVIYLPDKLASWRRHGRQATQSNAHHEVTARGEFRRLTKKAMKFLRTRNPRLAKALRGSSLNRFCLVSELAAQRQSSTSRLGKFCASVAFSMKHPLFSAKWIFTKLLLRQRITGEFQDAFQSELVRLGYRDLLRRIDYDYAGAS